MNIFQRNAKYMVIFASIAASTSGIFAKLVTVNVLTLGFYRHLFALPMFVIPVLLYHRDDLMKLTKRQVLLTLLAGVVLAVHFFSWFSCVKYTTIASAQVLGALHPLVVIFVTTFIFKVKIGRKAIIGIIIALVGGTIIAGFDYSFAGIAILGDTLAFGAAMAKGVYLSIGETVRKDVPSNVYLMLLFGMSFVCFTIGMIVTGTPFIGFPPINWVWIIGATLLCQIGAHAIWNWSMGYVPALYVSAWNTCGIVSAAIIAIFVFGEIPNAWEIVGAVVVIGGLLYYNFNDKRIS